jgi:hypothetical protein
VDAGYWPVRRAGQLGFWRDPKPVPLSLAVKAARLACGEPVVQRDLDAVGATGEEWP